MNQTLLWSTENGVQCVILPYDEHRFQLRLIRPEGTIKTDLFPGRAAALSAAGQWLEQVEAKSQLESCRARLRRY
jgi:hypothetical protein